MKKSIGDKVRDEKKFSSVNELISQIHEDISLMKLSIIFVLDILGKYIESLLFSGAGAIKPYGIKSGNTYTPWRSAPTITKLNVVSKSSLYE